MEEAAAVEQDVHCRNADADREGGDLGGQGTRAAGGEAERVAGGEADEMGFGSSVEGSSDSKSDGGAKRKSGCHHLWG